MICYIMQYLDMIIKVQHELLHLLCYAIYYNVNCYIMHILYIMDLFDFEIGNF